MPRNKTYICPVCGYDQLDEPSYDEYGGPTYNICPCCSTEFGNDDFAKKHALLRKKWIEDGMKWWSKNTLPPIDWNPTKQLKNLHYQELASRLLMGPCPPDALEVINDGDIIRYNPKTDEYGVISGHGVIRVYCRAGVPFDPKKAKLEYFGVK